MRSRLEGKLANNFEVNITKWKKTSLKLINEWNFKMKM